jgi:hypothetical protein
MYPTKIVIEKIRNSSGDLHDIQLCSGDFVRVNPNNPGGYAWAQCSPDGQVLVAFKEKDLLVIDLSPASSSTCQCSIKSLASGGHDPGCPAKRRP